MLMKMKEDRFIKRVAYIWELCAIGLKLIMTDISAILSDTYHRPFELPIGQWKYYQEWNKALFLHWTIPFNILRKYVPERLHIDSFKGNYYISLVAFTMQKIRPKHLPAIKFISDFHEINLRTYIDEGNKKGVFFKTLKLKNIYRLLLPDTYLDCLTKNQ